MTRRTAHPLSTGRGQHFPQLQVRPETSAAIQVERANPSRNSSCFERKATSVTSGVDFLAPAMGEQVWAGSRTAFQGGGIPHPAQQKTRSPENSGVQQPVQVVGQGNVQHSHNYSSES